MIDRDEADTIEIPAPDDAATDHAWPQGTSVLVQTDLAALSHRGLVRKNNEDHYLVVRYGRSLETVLTNLPDSDVPARTEEIGYGMVVADGMGGSAGGAFASRLAIGTLYELVVHTPDWILGTSPAKVQQAIDRMAERFRHINDELRSRGEEDPKLHGMGTTMTLACSLGSTLVIGHVGDSRAYLFRDGRLHQLTRDQNLVQSLVDLGCITAEQAAKHPYRHVLMHYLGSSPSKFEADFQRAELADGDQILLCTDGLTEMVETAVISSILANAPSSQNACQSLVNKALEKGGKDNVTVALARYRFVGEMGAA